MVKLLLGYQGFVLLPQLCVQWVQATSYLQSWGISVQLLLISIHNRSIMSWPPIYQQVGEELVSVEANMRVSACDGWENYQLQITHQVITSLLDNCLAGEVRCLDKESLCLSVSKDLTEGQQVASFWLKGWRARLSHCHRQPGVWSRPRYAQWCQSQTGCELRSPHGFEVHRSNLAPTGWASL